MIYKSKKAEQETILEVAKWMVTAARTAPKACGSDHLEAFILDGKEKEQLSEGLRKYGKEWNQEFMIRDAGNIEFASAVVFLGTISGPMGLSHCGYCGFENCGASAKAGAVCAHNTIDLGIAIGSAVSVAADHRIDNRVLYSAGRVAMELGFFSESVKAAVAIPLAVSSKNAFFDRNTGDNEAMLKEAKEKKK